jgi:hypothetical protein
MIVYKKLFQGSTSNFEPTCSIGQEAVNFYLSGNENSYSEVLLTGNMQDQFLEKY